MEREREREREREMRAFHRALGGDAEVHAWPWGNAEVHALVSSCAYGLYFFAAKV